MKSTIRLVRFKSLDTVDPLGSSAVCRTTSVDLAIAFDSQPMAKSRYISAVCLGEMTDNCGVGLFV